MKQLTGWQDITLQQCVNAMAIPMPDKYLSEIEAGANGEKDEFTEYNRIIESYTDEDYLIILPDYGRKVIEALGGEPEQNSGAWVQYKEGYELIIKSLYFAYPRIVVDGDIVDYTPPLKPYFDLHEVRYFVPENLHLFGREIPAVGEDAITFTEGSDMVQRALDLKGQGIDALAGLMAIHCRPKDEPYNERTITDRIPLFMELDMETVWSVFFYICESLTLYERRLRIYSEQIRKASRARVKDL